MYQTKIDLMEKLLDVQTIHIDFIFLLFNVILSLDKQGHVIKRRNSDDLRQRRLYLFYHEYVQIY